MQYKVVKFPDQIKKDLLDIRTRAEKLFSNYKNSFICHKGCADCCVVFAWSLIEAAYICYQFNRNTSLIDLNIFTKRINDLDKIFEERKGILTSPKSPLLHLRSSEEASYFSNILADQQCPFLSGNNSCIIYNFRPIICIMFGSTDKNLCKTVLKIEFFLSKINHMIIIFAKLKESLKV